MIELKIGTDSSQVYLDYANYLESYHSNFKVAEDVYRQGIEELQRLGLKN